MLKNIKNWRLVCFLRNTYYFKFRKTFVYKEAEAKLSMGVDYVCGCRVGGDIAEFGTASGVTAAVIARAMKRIDRTHGRNIHLFDSFKGLPEPESECDKTAPMVVAGDWKEGSFTSLSEIGLRKKMKRYLPEKNIKIYNGWFSETLKNIPKGTKFSMIHIDSDLYQSAKEILGYVFGQNIVSEGAIIFFDDYNGNRASPNYGERKAWREAVDLYSVKYDDAGDYGAGSKKFIVHSYKASIRDTI